MSRTTCSRCGFTSPPSTDEDKLYDGWALADGPEGRDLCDDCADFLGIEER